MPFISDESANNNARDAYIRSVTSYDYLNNDADLGGSEKLVIELPKGLVQFAKDYGLDMQEQILQGLTERFREMIGKVPAGRRIL
jgi:hypothetical protein